MNESGSTPRASASTVLALGKVRAEVSLYKTTTDKKPYDGIVTRTAEGHEVTSSASKLAGGGSGRSSGRKVIDTATGAFVDATELRRGIVRGDSFIDLTDELAAIDEETKLDEMKIVGFVPQRYDLHPSRIVGSYYLTANGVGAPKVLALLHAGLASKEAVGIVKWTKRTRQALGIIAAAPDGLLFVIELAFRAQVTEAPLKAHAHRQVEVSAREAAAVGALVDAMQTGPAVLNELEDDRDVLQAALFQSLDADAEFDPAMLALEDTEALEQFAAAVAE